jgi:hypothetical protein
MPFTGDVLVRLNTVLNLFTLHVALIGGHKRMSLKNQMSAMISIISAGRGVASRSSSRLYEALCSALVRVHRRAIRNAGYALV